ncbi:MAG: hypothetical protein FWH12_02700 [Treponema sp.]|nr:hypothetical protein [Treponema sp.]
MARMTDDEALKLSEHMANNEITLGPNGSGWLSQRELRISGLSNVTIQYLLVKAKAVNKSPVQIIDELVHKELSNASN